MYFIVLFGPGRRQETDAISKAHEAYIDQLIEQDLILLGGPWQSPVGGFSAAYVLRCPSVDHARSIATSDPIFREQVYEPTIVEWCLVGINPGAIDAGLLTTQ
jgi:uncharacterized protein YciI